MTNVDWKFVNNNVSIDDIKNIESTLDIKLPKGSFANGITLSGKLFLHLKYTSTIFSSSSLDILNKYSKTFPFSFSISKLNLSG